VRLKTENGEAPMQLVHRGFLSALPDIDKYTYIIRYGNK
jgi:hypothetical protein